MPTQAVELRRPTAVTPAAALPGRRRRRRALPRDTRRRFALRHLADSEITLTEVAYLLGYSEVSAFNRAFKRWTGSTPSDHRRQRVSR